MSRFRAGAASAALAAALVGVALVARAGTDLERTGLVEIALVALGATVVCAAVLSTASVRAYGLGCAAAFAALAILTALSIGWSIAPGSSFVETGRTLAYLAVFAGAIAAARLWPRAAPVAVRGVLLATVAIAVYGLAARVWPGAFDESTFGGRISQPFDYWNALGGAAAIGVVPALWLGSRRTGSALGRALAYPAVGILVATVLITQSRGALLAAVVAAAAWLAIVPLRLRTLALLGVGAAGAAPVAAWALSKDPFRLALQTESAREAVAGDFGLLLALTVVGLLAAGLLVEAARARWRPSLELRDRAGLAVVLGTALLCLGLTTSVAMSERGLTGTVSDRIDDLRSERSAAPPTGGGRFASTSSVRAEYWGEALQVFEERPATGRGAGTFGLARLRYRDTGATAAHAHGFLHQTLADLGLLGIAAALLALVAWLVATARTLGLGRRRGGMRPAWTQERSAIAALALAAVAYGAQSVADWTWFVPGVTVIGLVAAGYAAGRGPLPGGGALTTPAAAPRPRASVPRVAAAAAAALAAAAAIWTIWQPVAADRAVARAYELLDEGRPGEALAEAERARDHDGYAKDPLYARADALAALGREADALRALREAIVENPRDSDPWLRIATFQLAVLDEPGEAVQSIDTGLTIDPRSMALFRARAAAVARQAQRGAP